MLLVTGGAGYVGSHFIKRYLELHAGEQVVVVDDLSEGHREALAFSSDIYLHRGNVGDGEFMRRIIKDYKISAVAHFAASAYVGESQQNPVKYFDNNVVQSLNLFRILEECAIRRLIFSSSCAIYGPMLSESIDEEHPLDPISVYGLTKLMVEKALKAYAERLGWSVIALRYFNAAGADDSGLIGESHDPEPHIIPSALRVASGASEHVEVLGDDYDTPDGTCVRDFIHVSDIAEGHCLAVDRLFARDGWEVFNLGTRSGASVKEVVDTCERVSGRSIKRVIKPRRSGDPARLVADPARAQKSFGWTAKRNLEETIASAWRWEQNRRY